MKKIIPIFISLFLLFLFFEFIVTIFVKSYNYKYDFNTNENKKYVVEENYKYTNKKHQYNIKISNNKNTFFYTLNHNYHKNKMIMEDLYTFKKNNIECIFPVFKDNIFSSPECIIDGKLVSYEYMKKTNQKIEKLDNFLKNNNYKKEHLNRKLKNLDGTALSIKYYEDIPEDFNIVVWNYKGFFSINKDKSFNKDIMNFDIYDSRYITKTNDKLYIMNANSDDPGFDKIYTINFSDGTSDKMDVTEYELSTNIYFNGTYKNKVYLLDCSTNKQYKVDIRGERLLEVSKENKVKYYDGDKLKDMKLESISNSNILFSRAIKNDKITKLYDTNDIKENNGHYYFKDKDGNFYRSFNNDYKNSILLFNLNGLEEWSVVNDTIFGIYEDKLYMYDDSYGLYPIIVYNEFAYKRKNMYGVAIR